MGATVEGLSSRAVAASGSTSIAGTASAITQEDGIEDTHTKFLAASLLASSSGIRGEQRSHPPPVQACLMVVVVRWLHPSESDLARTKQSRNECKMCHYSIMIKIGGRAARYCYLLLWNRPLLGPAPCHLPHCVMQTRHIT